MSDDAHISGCGPFDDESRPVRVILVFRASGGWHLSSALSRVGSDPPRFLGAWTEPWSDRGVEEDWRYLEGRILDGSGGNGITYEIDACATTSTELAEKFASARARAVTQQAANPDRPSRLSGIPISEAAAPTVVAEVTGQAPSDPGDHPERTARPDWARFGTTGATVHSATSESALWGWAVPWVMRAAATAAPDGRWPAAPDRSDPDSAHGYWTALLHLLVFSFGWHRPDRGLRWWVQAGHPVADRRLRLIAETYLADGQLDWFMAWACLSSRRPPGEHQQMLYELVGREDDGVPVDVEERWVESQLTAAEQSGIPNPISGGSDPLHLATHACGPMARDAAPAKLRRSGRGSRSGVLVCESAVGWYRALVDEAAKLPNIADRRWRIDVIVKPIGWLGSYRKSPTTGMWFVGSHRLHLRGC